MSKKNNRDSALKRAAKRRARRPAATFVPPARLKATGGLERRMVREHEDVLQNIEFALVAADREADDIDDEVVVQALRAAVSRKDPEDPRAQAVLDLLNAIRGQRTDVSDEVWISALRVVFTSVFRHSDRQSGQRDYLDFVSQYIH